MSKQCNAISIAALSDGPFGSMFGRWLYIISVSAWASMSHVRSRNLKTRPFYPISIDTPEARWTTMDKLKKLGIRFVMVSSRAIPFHAVCIGGPRQLITYSWLQILIALTDGTQERHHTNTPMSQKKWKSSNCRESIEISTKPLQMLNAHVWE